MSVRPPEEKHPFNRVVCVGLGLVGGSCAKAARRAWPSAAIVGVDQHAISEIALQTGVIDHAFSTLDEAIEENDVVVICTPVLSIEKTLREHHQVLSRSMLVTDTGSSKHSLSLAATEVGLDNYVGGHPMAGSALSGLAHANEKLFNDATWFLCPAQNTSAQALRHAREFVTGLGARALETDASEHDRAVALTSHLPHLIVNLLAENVLDNVAVDAAGGTLRDLFKVAGGSFDVWWDTIDTNRDAIEASLDDFIARLSELKGVLSERDRVRTLFAQGRACRERLRGAGSKS